MATTEAFDFEAEHESEDEHVDRSSQDKEQDPTREHRLQAKGQLLGSQSATKRTRY